MLGIALPVISKRVLDFSTLATGTQQELTLADRVPLLHWRELSLGIRIHSHTLTGSNTITIKVYPQSWTLEEPGLPFVAAAAASQALNSVSPSPGFVNLTVPTLGSNGIADMARVVAVANRASAGTLQAIVSLVFSDKIA